MDAKLRAAIERAGQVRFLCSGNVVRSAFAELLARHLGLDLVVDSAATVYQNDALFPETRSALLERDVPGHVCASFVPRRLDRLPPGVDPARLVLGMTRAHLEAYAHARGLVEPRYRLLELLGVAEDLPDPVLDGADFGSTFRQVERAVRCLVALRNVS